MYAVIETGSKQYRVEEGDIIDVELIEPSEDGKVTFDKILFFHDGQNMQMGNPHIAHCLVLGEFLEVIKGPKVVAYKYKKSRNYRRKVGHRQKYSRVKITGIQAKKD
jgi:large subunit ribosomal protein L21